MRHSKTETPLSIQPRLLDQVRARIRTKHYSRRTEEAYVRWIVKFILFHNKKLLQRYGDNLVCVRYRYDEEKMMMFKTIEIIVDNKPWQADTKKIPKNKIMNIRIAIDEIDPNVAKVEGAADPRRPRVGID